MKRVLSGFPNVTLRHIVEPSVPLEGAMVPSDQTVEDLEREFDLGYADGAAQIEAYIEELRPDDWWGDLAPL